MPIRCHVTQVRYGVMPHAGGWQAGGVVPAALAFNQHLVVVDPGAAAGGLGDPNLGMVAAGTAVTPARLGMAGRPEGTLLPTAPSAPFLQVPFIYLLYRRP